MSQCKTCTHFVPNEKNSKTGSCLMFGDKETIESNAAVFDPGEEEGMLPFVDVGEDFGCIHHKSKIF